LEDDEINEAIFQPESPRLARKIYNFISRNSNLITVAGGMGHIATGLDRAKLSIVSKEYGIKLSKYMQFVDYYEELMLKQQSEED